MTASTILGIRGYITARVSEADHGFDSPCWDWQLSTDTNGYAHGNPPGAGRLRRMSRVAYDAFVGPIPGGKEIDHLCRNRRCVNPAHLEVVTRAENMSRVKWKRTVCLHGHPFEGDNIKTFSDGRRVCRTCNDAWFRERNKRRRAAA